MNQKKRYLLATLSALAMSPWAFAAEDHKGHDHDRKKGAVHAEDARPLYGGVVTQAKDINYELVAKPDTMALYIHDHGKPVDVKGATASVILLSANDKTELKLVAAGENKLEAKGKFNVAAGTKVAASVIVPGKPSVTVKFTLK